MSGKRLKKRFNVGDKVQLTGTFLRQTGQLAGGEGQSVWTVVECNCSLCASDRFVALDEPSSYDETQPRHIMVGNLKHFGKPSVLDDEVSPSVLRSFGKNTTEG